jgi:hypothetical protein
MPFGHGRLGVRLEFCRRLAGGDFGTVALVGRRLLPAFARAIALTASPATAPSAATPAAAPFCALLFAASRQGRLLAQSGRLLGSLL